jgi:hypothetical protein
MPPTPPPRPHVEPCCRCGTPAERLAVGCGHVGGEERGRLPLCVDCLTLLLEGVREFWEGMPGRGEG